MSRPGSRMRDKQYRFVVKALRPQRFRGIHLAPGGSKREDQEALCSVVPGKFGRATVSASCKKMLPVFAGSTSLICSRHNTPFGLQPIRVTVIFAIVRV